MRCENCGKNQARRAATGRDGAEVLLCEECYERLLACANLAAGELTPSAGEKTCPVCGTTYEDYRKSGLVGCAECYTVFRAELLPVIRRIHGRVSHTGAHPRGGGMLYELLEERDRLRAELETAVREKNMEKADSLNREITEISGAIARARSGESGDG